MLEGVGEGRNKEETLKRVNEISIDNNDDDNTRHTGSRASCLPLMEAGSYRSRELVVIPAHSLESEVETVPNV
ncbi:hypothetical protein J6590_045776 [Homalodisca vitripennis]|nr:hypothetical protein J6590_045776 [Homalodisca vitripennis]